MDFKEKVRDGIVSGSPVDFRNMDTSMFSKIINLDHHNVFTYDKDYNIINMELYSMNQGKYFPYQYSDNLYYSINIF